MISSANICSALHVTVIFQRCLLIMVMNIPPDNGYFGAKDSELLEFK